MTKYQTELTAFHEAGHAVAHAVLDLPFDYVTIVPEDGAAGHVAYTRPNEIVETWNDGDRDSAEIRHYIERELIATLAGLVAQKRRFPRSDQRMTVPTDLKDVDGNPLRRMAAPGADHTTAGRIVADIFGDDDVAFKYFCFVEARARALICDRWSAVERVAQALMDRHKLDYSEVLRLTYPPVKP